MQLSSRAFYRKTIPLMIPIVVQQLITIGINFMDNLMIGGFGETSISAAAFANQFYSFFQFVCMGLGSGAVVMSSQFWGQKHQEAMRYVAAMALRVTVGICLAFTALTVLRPGLVLHIFTNIPEVIDVGRLYMRLIGCTILMAGLSSLAAYLMRSVGEIKVALIGSGTAFVLNIFFNWVFIFGKLGAPRLELIGAAVGTIIARAFECAFVFGYFLLMEQRFRFRPGHFFIRRREISQKYIHYSIPVLISDTLLGLSLALTTVVIGHIGAGLAAANAIVTSLVQVLSVLNMGMAGASAVVIGNTVGRGERELAKSEGNSYIVLSLLIGAAIVPVLFLLQRPYFSAYAITDETRRLASSMMIYNYLLLPLQTMAYVISKGVLRGGGDTRFLLIADSSLVWFVSLPLGALSGLVWHLNPVVTYVLLKMEYPLKGLVCLLRYCSGKWIKEISVSGRDESA